VKLFVGGLSWGTDDHSLRAAFEAFGSVEEAVVISDRETGRSRGFGFVTFTNREDAQVAIERMNGAELDGRTIRCNEATERPRGGAGGGGGGFRGGFGGGGGGGRSGGGGRGGDYGGGGGRSGGDWGGGGGGGGDWGGGGGRRGSGGGSRGGRGGGRW